MAHNVHYVLTLTVQIVQMINVCNVLIITMQKLINVQNVTLHVNQHVQELDQQNVINVKLMVTMMTELQAVNLVNWFYLIV